MLSLKEIEKYYPKNLSVFKRHLLREYLQYEILQFIFDTEYAKKLSLIGGTCLRIVHNNKRFSEDLDFDNWELKEKDFQTITEILKKQLQNEGYKVEIRNVYKGAYRCYIKFPGLLFDKALSGHREEKILIQLDTQAQGFDYKSENHFLNKFDVFMQIFTTPLDILLSQKFFAIFNRATPKGRDFFDIIFLLSKTQPNYAYLDLKLGINKSRELKGRLIKKCESIDLKEIAEEVKPFLFNPADTKQITLFTKYIDYLEW